MARFGMHNAWTYLRAKPRAPSERMDNISGANYFCPSEAARVRVHRYRITIGGALGEAGREAFSDFLIEVDGSKTMLTGQLDQAGLYGALNRVQSLGLELVGLSRLTDDTA